MAQLSDPEFRARLLALLAGRDAWTRCLWVIDGHALKLIAQALPNRSTPRSTLTPAAPTCDAPPEQ